MSGVRVLTSFSASKVASINVRVFMNSRTRSTHNNSTFIIRVCKSNIKLLQSKLKTLPISLPCWELFRWADILVAFFFCTKKYEFACLNIHTVNPSIEDIMLSLIEWGTWNLVTTGFCPRWLGVVSPNHHSSYLYNHSQRIKVLKCYILCNLSYSLATPRGRTL